MYGFKKVDRNCDEFEIKCKCTAVSSKIIEYVCHTTDVAFDDKTTTIRGRRWPLNGGIS